MFRTTLPIALIILSILITGCANTATNENPIEVHIIEESDNLSDDSEQTLIDAENKYDAALKANMMFYSPSSVQQAKEVLKLARSKELNAEKEASLHASKKVLLLLKTAQKNKVKVESLLKGILAQKKTLDNLKTSRVLAAEYTAELNNIKQIIQKIEMNQEVDVLKDIENISSKLEILELNTLLAIHWTPAKNTLLKAKEEGADMFAETSFVLALDAVNKAEILIRNDYKDRRKVESNGITALRAAQKALYTARDAEFLVGLNRQQAENIVLLFQDYIAKIGTALKTTDVRHMALEDQANALAQVAETQDSRISAILNEKIMKLEMQLNQKNIDIKSIIKSNEPSQ